MIGLGLVGLIAVQLLRANGCKVLAVDPDPASRSGRRFGADVVDLAGPGRAAARRKFSAGAGIDGVLIAAATDSNEPVAQAARMCRQRGRIVLIGVAGLELNRADFYKKEISFQVSCSYGPGRYDEVYESRGIDYPFGLVRWTEQRNFQAVLQLMEAAQLDMRPLISHRFEFAAAGRAYDLLTDSAKPRWASCSTIRGGEGAGGCGKVSLQAAAAADRRGERRRGVHWRRQLRRACVDSRISRRRRRLVAIASASGISAARYGRKYGFERVSTDAAAILAAPDVDAVVIATRHDTHAQFVQRALAAGKQYSWKSHWRYTCSEMDAIEAASREGSGEGGGRLMIGFNRRFAPLAIRMKTMLDALPGPRASSSP